MSYFAPQTVLSLRRKYGGLTPTWVVWFVWPQMAFVVCRQSLLTFPPLGLITFHDGSSRTLEGATLVVDVVKESFINIPVCPLISAFVDWWVPLIIHTAFS